MDETKPTYKFCVPNCTTAHEMFGKEHGCLVYPMSAYGGELCLPKDHRAKARVVGLLFQDGLVGHVYSRAADLWQARMPIMISAAVSAVFPFLLVLLLRGGTAQVFVYGLALSVVLPAALGIHLLLSSQYPQYGSLKYLNVGDPTVDLYHGVVSLAFAGVLLLVYFYKKDDLETAIKSTEAASELVYDLPGMMPAMFAIMAVTVAVAAGWLFGMINLLSEADQLTWDRSKMEAFETSPESLKGNALNGDWYMLSDVEWFCITFFMFAGGFLYNFCLALGNFIVSYATEEWFFRNISKTSSDQLGAGPAVAAALQFHLGSLTFGAVLSTVFWLPCVFAQLINAIFAPTHKEGEDSADACHCFVDVYNRFFRYMGSDAYMDMACNANAFWKAGKQTVAVLEKNSTSASTLTPSIWILQFVYITMSGMVGAIVCFGLLFCNDKYRSHLELQYVRDPFMHVAVAGCFGAMLAAPFMIVLHQSASALLYCLALEYIRKPFVWGVKQKVHDTKSWLCECASQREEGKDNADAMDTFAAYAAVQQWLKLARA